MGAIRNYEPISDNIQRVTIFIREDKGQEQIKKLYTHNTCEPG
jgi:hypothetical protein